MSSFSGGVSPRTLLLESINSFGISEYSVVEKKKKKLWPVHQIPSEWQVSSYVSNDS